MKTYQMKHILSQWPQIYSTIAKGQQASGEETGKSLKKKSKHKTPKGVSWSNDDGSCKFTSRIFDATKAVVAAKKAVVATNEALAASNRAAAAAKKAAAVAKKKAAASNRAAAKDNAIAKEAQAHLLQAQKILEQIDQATARLHTFIAELEKSWDVSQICDFLNRVRQEQGKEPHVLDLETKGCIKSSKEKWQDALLHCLYYIGDLDDFLRIKKDVFAAWYEEKKVLSQVKLQLNAMSPIQVKQKKKQVVLNAFQNMQHCPPTKQQTLKTFLQATLPTSHLDEDSFWSNFMLLVGHKFVLQHFTV